MKKSQEDIERIRNAYILAVCVHIEISPSSLSSKSRKRPVPYARQLLCYFLFIEEKFEQMQIAEIFGWTEHSTVSVSVKIIQEWIQSNANNVREDIKGIRVLIVPSNTHTKTT